jgi:S-adenosylmethionine:tRNA ribosyltransferase-isomerase
MQMKLEDFNYHLPKELIADHPARPRDSSRFLVLEKKTGKIEHKIFYNIIDYLKKGDVLVLNNSKVFPARLMGKKADTGGKIEVFLLQTKNPPTPPLYKGGIFQKSPLHKGDVRGFLWGCLLGGKGKKEGLNIEFKKGLEAEVFKKNNDGTWILKFNKPEKEMMEIVEKIGRIPLPPYIKRELSGSDKNNYQTIYADDKKIGSVAAPTAGFHFTPSLIKKIKKKGVQIEYITLHVGLGTFMPVKEDDITKHKMHAEIVEIKKDAAKIILKAKKEKRRIIAVGTTSTRALEGCLVNDLNKPINKIENFIYPGYKFKIVDALITNFHLPKSTLLMLVSAFAGQKNINKTYREAIKKRYRFYSYGDSMFIC